MLNKLIHAIDVINWSRDWKERTYGYSIIDFPPTANATDIITISGATGVVVNVREITISGSATAAASLHLNAVKRTAPNVGGGTFTPSNVNFGQGISYNDSIDVTGPKATIKPYSSNPTSLGAGILTYGKANHYFPQTGVGTLVEEFYLDFVGEQCDPLVLRGSNESLTINLAGQVIPAGLSLYVNIMWTETAG